MLFGTCFLLNLFPMNGSPTQRHPGLVKAMSFLFLSRCLVGLCFLTTVGWGIYTLDLLILAIAGGILILMTILMGVQIAEGGGCRCAVCTTPLFPASRSQSGNISPRAKSLMASRRIYRSLSVLAGSYYHCNHCGEKVSCRPKQPELQEFTRVPQVTRMRSLPKHDPWPH